MASAKQLQWYKTEGAMLDRYYADLQKKWEELHRIYDLKFDKRIRDIAPEDIVKICRFYPIVRQVLGTVALNYPKMAFSVNEAPKELNVEDTLDATAQALMRLTSMKSHAHQCVFDALFTGYGVARIDFNPAGDEIIPPYVTNDDMAEDVTQITRMAPGFVHIDPVGSPHRMGDKRYIREKMWIPREMLLKDPDIQHKKDIRATGSDASPQELGRGEINGSTETQESEDARAKRESLLNGDFVLCERWHMRMDGRLVMFAKGVEQPIMDIEHPFKKQSFPQVLDAQGTPVYEVDEVTGELGDPVLDVDNPSSAPGWLVEQGFPFVFLRFDLHHSSFIPNAHLRYLEDIQDGIVEQITRASDLLKRTSRMASIAESELENNPELGEIYKTGSDGELLKMLDPNAIKVLDQGSVPPDVYNYYNLLRQQEQEIAALSPPQAGESGSATEAAIVASVAQINGNWMEASVSAFYEDCMRNMMQIMGDPRYEPANFAINVSPSGSEKVLRVLKAADFLWTFQIETRVGSTQPLYAELERDRTMQFVAYASQRPNFDQKEIDKLAAQANGIEDVDKVMADDSNPEAQRAAQLEHQLVFTGQNIDVLPAQDHQAHIGIHQAYQQDPFYTNLRQRAQSGLDPQAVQMVQAVDQKMQAHMQAHAQAEQEQQSQSPTGRPKINTNQDSLISQVRSDAQGISEVAQMDAAR
jgi:hypothetical protein